MDSSPGTGSFVVSVLRSTSIGTEALSLEAQLQKALEDKGGELHKLLGPFMHEVLLWCHNSRCICLCLSVCMALSLSLSTSLDLSLSV